MIETVPWTDADDRISRLGLGGCPLGGHGWGKVDDSESLAAVRRAVDRGIAFFDTADVYGLGHSEEILAKGLGALRHKVVIASKFGVRRDAGGRTCKDISPLYLRTALEASLRRLRVDCIPLYYAHWPDGVTPVTEVMSELMRVREEGKIRWIGLSNFSSPEVEQALAVGPVHAVQAQFSLLARRSAADLLPVVRRSKTALVTWGSLAQGMLTGEFDARSIFAADDRRSRYEAFQGAAYRTNLAAVEVVKQVAERYGKTPAQVAIRWLLDTPGVGAVLFGAKRPAQVDENLGADGWRLDDADYRLLEQLDTAL